MDFEFNAPLPRFTALEHSFAQNEIEADCKRLVADLFQKMLGVQAFDINVLGSAHLGSFDLVRRAVNADGLVLIQGDREEAATRYLYRAWKSSNQQGRGLHFLRTYLQMLFPNACEVEQLWQDKDKPYPLALTAAKSEATPWLYQLGERGLKLDGAWKLGGRRLQNEAEPTRQINTDNKFLTSRILIQMDFSVDTHAIADLIKIIGAVIPARLFPMFRFWLNLEIRVLPKAAYALSMDKIMAVRYPWRGAALGKNEQALFGGGLKLGKDCEVAKLPNRFGEFALGRCVGGRSHWRLKRDRVLAQVDNEITGTVHFWRVETLAKNEVRRFVQAPKPHRLIDRVRRLDGSWKLGGAERLGHFKLASPYRLKGQKMRERLAFGTFKLREHQPDIEMPSEGARLRLSTSWQLGGVKRPLFLFEIL